MPPTDTGRKNLDNDRIASHPRRANALRDSRRHGRLRLESLNCPTQGPPGFDTMPTPMPLNRHRRKPDLFALLVVFVVLGMGVTLAYQINLFYGGKMVPIARQAPATEAEKAIDG
ncbi:hypothetical protein CKO41_16150 [Thiococcus pfennigii]|nr:hypothetical protein [Thiococcus pfennigii]